MHYLQLLIWQSLRKYLALILRRMENESLYYDLMWPFFISAFATSHGHSCCFPWAHKVQPFKSHRFRGRQASTTSRTAFTPYSRSGRIIRWFRKETRTDFSAIWDAPGHTSPALFRGRIGSQQSGTRPAGNEVISVLRSFMLKILTLSVHNIYFNLKYRVNSEIYY